MLVTATDHPLAARAEIRIGDLADVTQVDTDGVSEQWRRWWSLDPRPDGTRPRYGAIVHTMEELLQVVASTDTVAITAASVCDYYPRRDVCYRRILDAEPTTIELLLAPGAMSPLVAELVKAATTLAGATRAQLRASGS